MTRRRKMSTTTTTRHGKVKKREKKVWKRGNSWRYTTSLIWPSLLVLRLLFSVPRFHCTLQLTSHFIWHVQFVVFVAMHFLLISSMPRISRNAKKRKAAAITISQKIIMANKTLWRYCAMWQKRSHPWFKHKLQTSPTTTDGLLRHARSSLYLVFHRLLDVVFAFTSDVSFYVWRR